MTRLLTLKEVAKQLNLSPRSVLQLANSGKLPPVRLVKRKLLFAPETVDAVIRQAEAGNQSAPIP
jgi:excisionase family DNA binding protein